MVKSVLLYTVLLEITVSKKLSMELSEDLLLYLAYEGETTARNTGLED